MHDAAISISVGVVLVALGVWLLRWHVRTWRGQREDDTLSERERRHYRGQFRRRMQISGMLVLIGVLIPVGDLLIPWQKFPRVFALYWGVVLLILAWIMLLAALDWLSSRMNARAARAALFSLQRKQRELEEEAARLRRNSNGNGSHE